MFGEPSRAQICAICRFINLYSGHGNSGDNETPANNSNEKSDSGSKTAVEPALIRIDDRGSCRPTDNK